MGLEYKLTCRDLDAEFYEQLVEKILAAVEPNQVARYNEDLEISFEGDSDKMPDISIQRTSEPNEFIFLYNGGTMNSWSIFGVLVSYLSQHSEDVTVEEL